MVTVHKCPHCGLDVVEVTLLDGVFPVYKELNGASLKLGSAAPRVVCVCGKIVILIKGER